MNEYNIYVYKSGKIIHLIFRIVSKLIDNISNSRRDNLSSKITILFVQYGIFLSAINYTCLYYTMLIPVKYSINNN